MSRVSDSPTGLGSRLHEMPSEIFTPVSESEFNASLDLFRGADLSNPEFVMYAVVCGGHGKRELERIGRAEFLVLKAIVRRRFDNVISNLFPTYGAIVEILDSTSIDFIVEDYLGYGIGELYYFNKKHEVEFLNAQRSALTKSTAVEFPDLLNDTTSIVMKFYIEDGFSEKAAVRYLRLDGADG